MLLQHLAGGQGVNAGKKIREGNSQRLGQIRNSVERNVARAALDVGDIGAVKPGAPAQLLLGEAQVVPAVPHCDAEAEQEVADGMRHLQGSHFAGYCHPNRAPALCTRWRRTRSYCDKGPASPNRAAGKTPQPRRSSRCRNRSQTLPRSPSDRLQWDPATQANRPDGAIPRATTNPAATRRVSAAASGGRMRPAPAGGAATKACFSTMR